MKQLLCGLFVLIALALPAPVAEAQEFDSDQLSPDTSSVASSGNFMEEGRFDAASLSDSQIVPVRLKKSIWESGPDTELKVAYAVTLDEREFTWPDPRHGNEFTPESLAWHSGLPHLNAAAFPSFNLASVPEPATYALVGFSALALIVYLKRG